jgi:hypothetical protein
MTDHLVVPKLADHPLKDVHRLGLEVVLAIVDPAEESGDEHVQVLGHDVVRQRDYGDLHKAQSGLDDFAILRRDKDSDSCDKLRDDLVGEIV